MGKDNSKGEFLSTVGGIDAIKVLSLFDTQNIVLVVVEAEGREKRTGNLPEKGLWTKTFWSRVLAEMPDAEGCRLHWSRVFFAFPPKDIEDLKEKFRNLLQELFSTVLVSFCVLAQAKGSIESKVRVLDDMEHEVGSKISFGLNPEFQHRLLDGTDWYPPQH